MLLIPRFTPLFVSSVYPCWWIWIRSARHGVFIIRGGAVFSVFTRYCRLSRLRRLTPSCVAGNDCAVVLFPSCPHLPAAVPGMNWRALHAFRDGDRGGGFYLECLRYAASLWENRFAARSLLCLDRAMGADLEGAEPEVIMYPVPYAAVAWIIAHTPDGVFLGNPRVHFQHYAGRMNEPRREQRIWRAWACWALTRAVRPDLPGDPRHRIGEPDFEEIVARLARVGLRGESALFSSTLEAVQSGRI